MKARAPYGLGILLFTILACGQITPTPQTKLTAENATVTPGQANLPAATLRPPLPFTPQPTPVPLYFTEDFNAGLSAWKFIQTGGAQPARFNMEEEALLLRADSPHTWAYAIHQAHTYASAFLRMEFRGEPAGSAGLVCDYDESRGWYEFNVTHEGRFSVLRGTWLAEGIAQYRPLLNDSSEYLQAGNFAYEIGLTCAKDTLLLHINGKLFRKLDVSHIGLGEGLVGLAFASFDAAPATARVNWFSVSAGE